MAPSPLSVYAIDRILTLRDRPEKSRMQPDHSVTEREKIVFSFEHRTKRRNIVRRNLIRDDDKPSRGWFAELERHALEKCA
jgi:hypothetical protein